MKTWTQFALMGLALAGLLGLSWLYSRKLDNELGELLEIAALERIPVLGDER